MAAVNRFDQPIRQRYQSTYIPLPFDDILKAGAYKQQQFDKGLDEINATQNMINIQADPKRTGIANQLSKKYNDKIIDLSDRYAATGDPSVLREVGQLQREYANDETRKALEFSATQYGLYEKDRQKAVNEGTYAEGLAGYDPYESTPVTDEQGNLLPFQHTGLKTKQDYIGEWKPLIDNIASDKTAWENVAGINQYQQLVKKDGSRENITDSKAYKVAKQLVSPAMAKAQSQYFIDRAFGKSYKSYDNLDNTTRNIPIQTRDAKGNVVTENITEKEYIDRMTAQELVRLAAPQIFENTSSGISMQNLSEAQSAKLLEGGPEFSITPGDIVSNKDWLPGELKGFYKEDGSIDYNSDFMDASKEGFQKWAGVVPEDLIKGSDSNTAKAIRYGIKVAKKYNLPITNEEGKVDYQVLMTNVYKYLVQNKLNSSRNVQLDSDLANNLNRHLVGKKGQASNLRGRDIKVGDQEAWTSGSTFDHEEYDKESINIIDLDWSGNPGDKIGSVKKKDDAGTEVDLRIRSKNENEKAHFRTPYAVNKSIGSYLTNPDYDITKSTGLSEEKAIERGNQIAAGVLGQTEYNPNIKLVHAERDESNNRITMGIVDMSDPSNPNSTIVEFVETPTGLKPYTDSKQRKAIFTNLDEWKSYKTGEFYNSPKGEQYKRGIKPPKEDFN